MKPEQEITTQIKTGIEYLFNLVLENNGVYREYTDFELFQATLIFMEVFMAKMHDHHKDKLSQKQLEELARESGNSLRQTILLFTGVDLHTVNSTKP